jgi:hypothetical protein
MQNTQLNTQLNDVYADVHFTDEQREQLAALTQEWNTKCAGDYESTFVGGVAHGYCDSGIMTDGLSAADVAMFSKYFTGETIYSAEISIDELEALVARMEDSEWETDLFKFVAAVEAVLTEEQQKSMDATEAALSYCWECCE